MSNNSEHVFKAALDLPRDEKISLAHKLLSTVEEDNFPFGPKVTAEEILELAEEALSGNVKTIDAFEALDQLDQKYSRAKANAA